MNRLLPTLLLSCLPLCAQDERVEPARPPAPRSATVVPVVLSLSFSGGTMAELVAQIRRLEPKANIAVASEAATATLPPMELRSAGLEQTLEAACSLAVSDRRIRMMNFRGPGEPVFTVLAEARPANPSAADQRAGDGLRTEIVSLNRLTADGPPLGFPVGTILSAIETACEAGGAPTMRYHKESGILVLRGVRGQMEVAEAVLRNLERDVEARRKQENARKGIAPPVESK